MAAEPANAEAWNLLADVGRALLVGTAIVGPLPKRDSRLSFDAITAVLATVAVCKATKALWDEPRPNGENDKSFPSQHAAECTAAATILHRKWPDSIGAVAAGVATAVAMARLFSGKHHVVDIVAGSAAGFVAARLTDLRG